MVERWYLIESDTVQPAYVKAESQIRAKQIFASRFGHDQELSVKGDAPLDEDFDPEEMMDTPQPPFRSLEENDNHVRYKK